MQLFDDKIAHFIDDEFDKNLSLLQNALRTDWPQPIRNEVNQKATMHRPSI